MPGHAAFKNAKYVFHLAGIGDIVPSIEKPLEYMSVNVIGTVNVLECCRQANIEKLVYASSSSCYGIASTPTSETHKINPLYPYAISKYQGEQACFHWNKVYGLPINSICIFNAYGPRVRTSGAYGAVFGVFFKQKLSKKPLTVVEPESNNSATSSVSFEKPAPRGAVKLVEADNIDELISLLHNEAKVI